MSRLPNIVLCHTACQLSHSTLQKSNSCVCCLHVCYCQLNRRQNPCSCLFAKLWNSTRQGSAIKINMEVQGFAKLIVPRPPPPLRKCNGNRLIKKKCHKFWLLARNQLNWQELHCCWLAINQKLLFWISVWPVIMKSASTVNGILLKVRAEEILHFK